MSTELLDFFAVYAMSRHNDDINYKLEIRDIDTAVQKVGTDKEKLTAWLDENT